MVTRLAVILALTLATILPLAPAQGDPLIDFCHSIPRDIKRRQCWPKPFICPDREAVYAPFTVMVANGWKRQNTLGDSYFEEATGQLTEAGALKVRWIATEAPEQHREIYVHRAGTPEETAGRINAVQQTVARLVAPGQVIPVMETNRAPVGWPADQVDAIGRKFQSTIPAPRLATQGNSGGSSGTEAK